MIREPLSDEGYEIADVVVSTYRNNATVRVFLYGPNGVSLGACAKLSRLISPILDHSGLFGKDGCALEVSSPGLDRPLTTVLDFKYRVGEKVRVEFVDDKRKKLLAEIVEAGDQQVRFSSDEGIVAVDLQDIKQATIVY